MAQRYQSSWFITPAPNPDARIRLFCLPYAGGTAAVYSPWTEHIDSSIELVAIQLPGRANRIFEEPFHSLDRLIQELTNEIRPWLNMPFALFGHSLGSRIALQLLHTLFSSGDPEPEFFIASGSQAPHAKRPPRNVWSLPETEFIEELKRLNGTPAEILSNKELMELHLPMLKADFRLADAKINDSVLKFSCNAWVFGGTEDTHNDEQELRLWGEYFHQHIKLTMFDGGHFFIDTQRQAVVDQVNKILTSRS